ncbi:hypothetical protein CAPTEDRAFT_174092 [Capitella teleta]|uniref:RING-type E3 ubiquitin transferase n=1 Tax=Capitella teleta TaxID=283909 RepID=R7TPF4_CAPTE|nr:hypothetical protein CAPTEDRAFT_174092 [Capitella teleta]|eukprot:ELT95768.1 hypothetical protein CAPTEDRAFT_174092 [Capitella teleta]
MRSGLIGIGSLALSIGVVANAYLQKKQFYPSVVYLTKSSPSMAVLYIQAFVFVIMMWEIACKLFFGTLRAAEMEHLIERSWYALTETCLAFTVFRDDFSPRFVAMFTLLLFLKCFHWLAEDRVDYMERSPLISGLFHVRVILLLTVLGCADGYLINHAYHLTLNKGATVQLVFGFEYAILLTAIVHIFVKYILHGIDIQSENPWENKAVYLLYSELVLGFIKVVLYILFLVIMIKVHTFPLFAIRPMYLAIRTFKKALNDVILSRRAINNMNTLYPDATPEELAAGDVCIICREDMVASSKKLPCGHIFHTSCLRSWFQRQQTCPTCRLDILRPPTPSRPTPQPQPAAAADAPQPPPFFPGWQPPQQPAVSTTSPPPTMPSPPPSGAAPGAATPAFMMPPFMMPFSVPLPSPPVGFSGLSDDELRRMEGDERQAVEARIQVLRNVHTLLDAAIVQLNQYSSVAGPPTVSSSAPSSVATATVTSTQTPISSPASQAPAQSAGPASPEEGATASEPTSPDSPSSSENSEMSEIRRRRLEKFKTETEKPETTKS